MAFTNVGQILTLNKLGSDCNEKLFRDIGGHGAFKANCRNYTMYQFGQRLNKMITSMVIRESWAFHCRRR